MVTGNILDAKGIEGIIEDIRKNPGGIVLVCNDPSLGTGNPHLFEASRAELNQGGSVPYPISNPSSISIYAGNGPVYELVDKTWVQKKGSWGLVFENAKGSYVAVGRKEAARQLREIAHYEGQLPI